MPIPLAAYIVGGVVGGAILDGFGKSADRKASAAGEAKAKADALESRRAEKFASTKGKGLGSYGRISLDIDDDDDAGLMYSRKKKKTKRLQLDE